MVPIVRLRRTITLPSVITFGPFRTSQKKFKIGIGIAPKTKYSHREFRVKMKNEIRLQRIGEDNISKPQWVDFGDKLIEDEVSYSTQALILVIYLRRIMYTILSIVILVIIMWAKFGTS